MRLEDSTLYLHGLLFFLAALLRHRLVDFLRKGALDNINFVILKVFDHKYFCIAACSKDQQVKKKSFSEKDLTMPAKNTHTHTTRGRDMCVEGSRE